MMFLFGAKVVATFILSTIIARWISHLWNGGGLSPQLTLLGGLAGLSIAAAFVRFPIFIPQF
jgi:hypothetical protein